MTDLKNLSSEDFRQHCRDVEDEKRRREDEREKEFLKTQAVRDAKYRAISKIPGIDTLRPIRVKVPIIVEAELDWVAGVRAEPFVTVRSNVERLVRLKAEPPYRRLLQKAYRAFLKYVDLHELSMARAVDFIPSKVRRVEVSDLKSGGK